VDEEYTTKYKLQPIYFKFKYPTGLDQKALVAGVIIKAMLFLNSLMKMGSIN